MPHNAIIECPHCATVYEIPRELLGTVGLCRPCGRFFLCRESVREIRVGLWSCVRNWLRGWFGR